MGKETKSYAGATVELADQETGFYDPETQFGISRDQKGKVGDTVGRKTNTAILSGRLLVVGGGRMLGAGKTDETDATDAPAKAKRSKKAAAEEN